METIGPYQVLRRLGAGGMAETYVAERRGPGGFLQHACLKCIRPDMAHDQEFVRQFLSEARILATLRHATIVQVLDFGQEGSRYYLALELIEGADLHALLQHVGRLTPAMCLQLAIDLASALEVAHRSRVIHRDVSPSNVLVSRAGEVKLTDFGIAKSATTGRHTRTGVIKGKVPYMAPEYTQSGVYDPSCDLFALGVVLFECLAGERPYEGATDIDTLARACVGRHRPLASLVPEAPPALCRAFERLVHPDPAMRPASATLLLDELLDLHHDPRARRALGRLVTEAFAPDGIASTSSGRPTTHSEARARTDDPQAAAFGPTVPLTTPTPIPAPGAAPTHVAENTPRAPILSDTSGLEAVWPARSGRKLGPRLAMFAGAAVLGLVLALWLRDRRPTPATTAEIPADAEARAHVEPPLIASRQPEQAVQAATEPMPTPRPTEPPAGAPPPYEPAPEAPLARPATKPRTPPATPAPRPSHLTVIVIPYGDVSIDGKAYGQAPITAELPPGRHRVVADTATQRLTRTIRLAPGKKRKVVLQ